jgi:hypothetical protein
MIAKKEFLSFCKYDRKRLFGCVTWEAFNKGQRRGLDLQDEQPHEDSRVWDRNPSPWVDGFVSLNACEDELLVIS